MLMINKADENPNKKNCVIFLNFNVGDMETEILLLLVTTCLRRHVQNISYVDNFILAQSVKFCNSLKNFIAKKFPSLF